MFGLTQKRRNKHLSLVMSPDVQDRISVVMERNGASKPAEVIRRSLAVYDHLWERKAAGDRIVVESPDGTRKELVLE